MSNLFKIAGNVDWTRASQYIDQIGSETGRATDLILTGNKQQKFLANTFDDLSTAAGGVTIPKSQQVFQKLTKIPDATKVVEETAPKLKEVRNRISMYDALVKQEIRDQLTKNGVGIQDGLELSKILEEADVSHAKLTKLIKDSESETPTARSIASRAIVMGKFFPQEIDKFNLITKQSLDTPGKAKDLKGLIRYDK